MNYVKINVIIYENSKRTFLPKMPVMIISLPGGNKIF